MPIETKESAPNPQSFTVSSSFIAIFKLGDNINYNLEILETLYGMTRSGAVADPTILNKPKFILIVSIIEAALYDFYFRCRKFTREGVVNIGLDFLKKLTTVELRAFDKYLDNAKAYEVLGPDDSNFYDVLKEMARLRNRVHIQNEKGYFERDDRMAFTSSRVRSAQIALERVLKFLSVNHPRGEHIKGHVDDFIIPWPEHFTDPNAFRKDTPSDVPF